MSFGPKSEKKKIMVILPPGTGHVNPMCCLTYELCHQKDVDEVIFYGDEQHRQIIEKTGAKFRLYSHPTFSTFKMKLVNEKQDPFPDFIDNLLKFSQQLLPQMIEDVLMEKPDLIIVDSLFMPGKYLLEILKARKIETKSIIFIPNFAFNKAVMAMNPVFDLKIDLATIASIVKVFLRQFWLSWSYGISVFNPIGFFLSTHERLNIVGVFPEIQPRRDDFDSKFQFVGPLISDACRSVEIVKDVKLNSILDLFEVKCDSEGRKSELKLIYVSLGTVFNHNLFIFEAVIEAIRKYDSKPNRRLKVSQLKFIFSVGEKGLAHFNEKSESGGYKIPDNVFLFPKVPQLEVLKRTDLFITHCGMNSTSEAIKYGVPMICIPLSADQPVVAVQMCDKMSLGKRLDPLKLDPEEIGDVIDEVLGNEKYRMNMVELSKVSAKYDGVVEGTKIIMDYMNEKDFIWTKKSN